MTMEQQLLHLLSHNSINDYNMSNNNDLERRFLVLSSQFGSLQDKIAKTEALQNEMISKLLKNSSTLAITCCMLLDRVRALEGLTPLPPLVEVPNDDGYVASTEPESDLVQPLNQEDHLEVVR